MAATSCSVMTDSVVSICNPVSGWSDIYIECGTRWFHEDGEVVPNKISCLDSIFHKVRISYDENWFSSLKILMKTHFRRNYPLREVSEFGVFLVRIFPNSDWIRVDTDLSLFSAIEGKCRPEQLRIWTFFTQWSFKMAG